MKKVGIIVVVFAAIAFIGYVVLGGFKEVKIARKSFTGYTVCGIAYKGKATDNAFKDLFEKVRSDYTTGNLKGTLTAVYYDTPGAAKGKVDAFVGTIVKDSLAALPAGYSYINLPGKEVVQAIITSHPAVAPAPDKIKSMLMAYAWKNKLKPQNLVIEKYFDQRNIEIEIPVWVK